MHNSGLHAKLKPNFLSVKGGIILSIFMPKLCLCPHITTLNTCVKFKWDIFGSLWDISTCTQISMQTMMPTPGWIYYNSSHYSLNSQAKNNWQQSHLSKLHFKTKKPSKTRTIRLVMNITRLNHVIGMAYVITWDTWHDRTNVTLGYKKYRWD